MSIRFACPVCKTDYTVNDRDAGKKAECKTCGQRLQVPPSQRAKTVLGEVLPGPHVEPTTAPRPSSPRAARPAASEPVTPIRFNCPHCNTSYTVNRASAGKPMDCRSCLETITIPGTPAPASPPQPAPTQHIYQGDATEPADPNVSDYQEREQEPEPEQTPYLSYPAAQPQMSGFANRIVAGVAAGLLFVGLFTPMVHLPLGAWMSFIDVPWKAATVGFMVADEVSKADPEPQRTKAVVPRNAPPPKADPEAAKNARKGLLFTLVVLGSVAYPFLIGAAVVFTAIQIATGRSRRGLVFAGGACAAATVMYAFGLVLLNAVEELRVAMLMTSPGVGWAIMLVGSVALLVSGLVRVAPPADLRS
jgi:transcription elongation factor Elf1